jgi:hypothetical protein
MKKFFSVLLIFLIMGSNFELYGDVKKVGQSRYLKSEKRALQLRVLVQQAYIGAIEGNEKEILGAIKELKKHGVLFRFIDYMKTPLEYNPTILVLADPSVVPLLIKEGATIRDKAYEGKLLTSHFANRLDEAERDCFGPEANQKKCRQQKEALKAFLKSAEYPEGLTRKEVEQEERKVIEYLQQVEMNTEQNRENVRKIVQEILPEVKEKNWNEKMRSLFSSN